MQQTNELTERRGDGSDCCLYDCHTYCLAPDAIELGRGSSGVVFRIPSCEARAFKRFTDTAAYSQEKDTALQIVRRIQSPSDGRLLHYLALPYAFCDDHQCAFMRLLDPQSDLERILTESGRRWTVGEAKTIAVTVCHIVQALHNSGVVHGDLKAKNMNITLSGPVIFDCGLSALSSSSSRSESDVSRAYLRQRDERQLLHLILQLRFRLPLLSVYEEDLSGEIVEAGLLIFDGDAEDDDERDSRWEVRSSVYVLAGDRFDALMTASDAEDGFFFGHILALIDDLFDDGDAAVYCHRADLWAAVGRLTSLLDTYHKELTSMVARCGHHVVHDHRGRCAFIDSLRSIIDEALGRFTHRLRQLLSTAPPVGGDGGVLQDTLAHLHTSIHQSFTAARGILLTLSTETWDSEDASRRGDAIVVDVARCFSAV